MSIIQQQESTAGRLTVAHTQERTSWLKAIVQLFKLRVVTLLVFASLGGAFIGAGQAPGIGPVLLVFFGGGLGAAGASAINQYLERHMDAEMKRTSNRPMVNGMISNPHMILALALAMIGIPVATIGTFNPPMALFILLGAIIYVIVYTVWLKPRTILNIVIGGAAGSCAVLTGGAAVGAWNDPGVILLSMIVFLWTPTHFWALAIMCKDDYMRVDIPMLPAKTNNKDAANWAFLHAVAVVFVAILLSSHSHLGWLYFIPTVYASWVLLKHSWRLVKQPESQEQAKTLFMTSNYYLSVILLFACLSTVIGF